MQRVLITGGAGFIGRNLMHALGGDREITVVDSLERQVHRDDSPTWLPPGVRFLPVDVRNRQPLDVVIREARPEILVHLAAETGTGQSLMRPSLHCETNVVGLANVLEACAAVDRLPSQVILTSSRAVYGEGAWTNSEGEIFYPEGRSITALDGGRWEPWSESHPKTLPGPHRAHVHFAQPTNVYGASKLAQENVLTAWGAGLGVTTKILRLQNVYGFGQALANPYVGVLLHFMRRAASGLSPRVFEDGLITRDFVHVKDVASALAASIDRNGGLRATDIGSGEPKTLMEVASLVSEIMNAPPPTITGEHQAGDIRSASADIADANTRLNWTPSWDLDVGLAALIGDLGFARD